MGRDMRHTLGASLNIRLNLSSSKGPKPVQLKLLTIFFSFTAAATPDIYTLSLHDALPISRVARSSVAGTTVGGAQPSTGAGPRTTDRKSTRLNSSHVSISYAVFCLKKKTSAPLRAADIVHAHAHALTYS